MCILNKSNIWNKMNLKVFYDEKNPVGHGTFLVLQ